MNGASPYGINIPLPGGGAAVYGASGFAYFRHANRQGSAALSTTWGRAPVSSDYYTPFGFDETGAGAGYPGFTGQPQNVDSSHTGGQYDFMDREYNSMQGRWWTPDPAGLAAVDPSNPQSWNEYAYVAGTPLEAVDPNGLSPTPPFLCGNQDQFTCIARATGTAYPIPPAEDGPGAGWGWDWSYQFFLGGWLGSAPGAGPAGPPQPAHPRSGGGGPSATQSAAQGGGFLAWLGSNLQCGASGAQSWSVAGIAQRFGVGGFLGSALDALGGNVFSGAVNVGADIIQNQVGVGDVAHAVLESPTLGVLPPSIAPYSVAGTVHEAIGQGIGQLWDAGSGIATIAGEATTAAFTAGEIATGLAEAKYAVDAATFAAATMGCMVGLIH